MHSIPFGERVPKLWLSGGTHALFGCAEEGRKRFDAHRRALGASLSPRMKDGGAQKPRQSTALIFILISRIFFSRIAVLRVAVVGAPSSGKSSVIKRIVTHRFDNLPTRNAEFMGRPSDGKYVHMMTMPPAFGKLGAGVGLSNVLLEMQDQLGSADALLREPFWFEVAEAEAVAPGLDELSPRSKLLAATAAAANRQTDDESLVTTEHWTKKVDPRQAQKAAAALAADAKARKDEPKPPPRVGAPDPDPHPLMQTNYKIEAQLSTKAMRAAAEHPGVNPLTVRAIHTTTTKTHCTRSAPSLSHTPSLCALVRRCPTAPTAG